MAPGRLGARQLSSGSRLAPSFVVFRSLFLGGTVQSCLTPFFALLGLPPARVLELLRRPDLPPFMIAFPHERVHVLELRATPGAKEQLAREQNHYRPISTAILRHLPWLNRSTLNAQRVAWPMRIATHM